MTAQVTTREQRAIARPLKTLIPLIQSEIQQGNTAGHEHYTNAGKMLLEAKEQVPHGRWGTWLGKNFDLTPRTASNYMRWAKLAQNGGGASDFTSMRQMTGHTERLREDRGSKQQQEFRRVMRDIARDDFVQDRQKVEDEIKLHRELAADLVDAGYRALSTKLHPDRGGSKEAMTRLNRVRDELKAIAQSRRFV